MGKAKFFKVVGGRCRHPCGISLRPTAADFNFASHIAKYAINQIGLENGGKVSALEPYK